MPWPLRMVSYAAIVLFILFLYFGVRYFRSIELLDPNHAGLYKMIFGLSAFLFFAYPVWGLAGYWFTGSYDQTGIPDFFIYLFWYGLIFSGVMLNWVLIHDLLLPIFRKISSQPAEWMQYRFAGVFLILTLTTFLFTAVKLVWDTHRITTEFIDHTITIAEPGFKPLRVIHIADLHADPYTGDKKMARYINQVNALNPDLVLFGGDLITSGTDHVVAGANALGNIRSTYGTFAVLGDHDYWNQPELIIETLEREGVRVLQDINIRIDHYGHSIRITGITELYSKMITPGSLSSLMDDMDDDALKILFAHQTTDRIIEQSRESGVHLALGAHTHGGQIRIPIFFYKATAARSETRYVNGHWFKDQMLLNVNNGLGFTLSPVRYNAPAQVSVIDIRQIPE